jgi:exonuclease III
MSLLSWNCRGLGNPQTVQFLRRLVKEKSSCLVFLMETKRLQNNVGFLKVQLGFDNLFAVDCIGRSGGLILLWKSSAQVTIQNYSLRHINAEFQLCSNGPLWKFTGFYVHRRGPC